MCKQLFACYAECGHMENYGLIPCTEARRSRGRSGHRRHDRHQRSCEQEPRDVTDDDGLCEKCRQRELMEKDASINASIRNLERMGYFGPGEGRRGHHGGGIGGAGGSSQYSSGSRSARSIGSVRSYGSRRSKRSLGGISSDGWTDVGERSE